VPSSAPLQLERMVRLATEDEPDVVALQEVPVWALRRLGDWSSMIPLGAVTVPALAGPLARRLTDLDPARLRSALTGQANALLLGSAVEVVGRHRVLRLDPPSFRRSEARRLGLPLGTRVQWTRNRRVAQLVPVLAGGREILVVNLHATSSPDRRLAEAEVRRLGELLRGDGPCVLCGDFNLTGFELPPFSSPGAGVDHILVRGLELERGPEAWSDERRRLDGRLLSDHAPVEAVVA